MYDDLTLRRLSNLELRQYAGDLDALMGDNRNLFEKIARDPVSVRLIVEDGDINPDFYAVIKDLEGKYPSFIELRRKTIKLLATRFDGLGWNSLTCLFDGVFIGEAEDLWFHREDRGTSMYPVEDLGKK